jgi:hypothetical protein
MGRKKKQKKRTSKRLRNLQTFERGISAASHRVANAVEIGLDNWQREHARAKRRDGRVGAAWAATAFAAGRMAREASWAPSDLFFRLGRRMDPRRLFVRAIFPFWR